MNSSKNDLFIRYPENPILTADMWPYPVNTVFNTAATLYDDETLLLVRVEGRDGLSHLTTARSADGYTNWKIENQPALFAEPESHPEEEWGLEDARITYLEEADLYAITYTAYSVYGPLVALATTRNFIHFDKYGPILPPDNKDSAFFPIQFKGRWAILHRPYSPMAGKSGNIWISFSPDMRHWGEHQLIMSARSGGLWDAGKIGISAQPVAVPEGWLLIYHGVKDSVNGSIYRLGLALLDRDDPTKVLHRTNEWIMAPQMPYEQVGDVNNVVFSNGWVVDGDDVRLYYGGADTCVAVTTASLKALREFIVQCPTPAA